MTSVEKVLVDSPVVYVARDIERALGFTSLPKGYFIITNDTPYAQVMRGNWPKQIFLMKRALGSDGGTSERGTFDTHELLGLLETKERLLSIEKDTGKKPALLVFKNTRQIERLAEQLDYRLLNPKAELADRIENKLTQIEALGEVAKYFPPDTGVAKCGEVVWANSEKVSGAPGAPETPGVPTALIVQFAHAHTGEGTILVQSAAQLAEIQGKFSERPVRVSRFVKGPVYTSNNCVTSEPRSLQNMFGFRARFRTLVGNISYQITGLAPFTDLPFSTVGNDWSHATGTLTEPARTQFIKMTEEIGARLHELGWKGLFGVDALLDESGSVGPAGTFYLLEINARQPASTSFESELQSGVGAGQTIFEAHLLALLGHSAHNTPLQNITEGGQVIQRLTQNIAQKKAGSSFDVENLRADGYKVIEYANTKPNSDLLRIQSKKGIIDSPLCNTVRPN